MKEVRQTDKIDVAYVANLARLQLTEKETALFQVQLDSIVGHLRELEKVNVDGIEPMAHTIRVQNVFREDVPRVGLDRDTVLANAPQHNADQFLVPKIV